MKLRIASDLHLEFYEYRPSDNIGLSPHRETNETIPLPVMQDEKNTVLILAGDIISAKKISDETGKHPMDKFFNGLSIRFKHIIVVAGNHEHYGSEIEKSYQKLAAYYARWPNITFLENTAKVIDDVVFYGATLWTDFNKNPNAMIYAQRCMADFLYIMNKDKIFTPGDSADRHEIAMLKLGQFLFHNTAGKRVIVTHHSPSNQSCSPKFKGSMLNPAFHNNLDNFIIKEKPTLWVHGHTHDSSNYMLEDTRIICNPYGYYGENVGGYVKDLVYEI